MLAIIPCCVVNGLNPEGIATDEVEALKAEITELKAKVESLESENESLKSSVKSDDEKNILDKVNELGGMAWLDLASKASSTFTPQNRKFVERKPTTEDAPEQPFVVNGLNPEGIATISKAFFRASFISTPAFSELGVVSATPLSPAVSSAVCAPSRPTTRSG